MDSVRSTYTEHTIPEDIRRQFNQTVDEYNSQLSSHKEALRLYNSDLQEYEERIKAFNVRVDRYNSSR